jgi:hypothetical protein
MRLKGRLYWNPICSSRKKEMARSKDEPLLEETSKETTSPRKMPALPLLPQKLSYSHVSLMLKKAGMWQLLIFPMLDSNQE